MNETFGMLGIESWKPVLTALLLPPVPLLVLVLVAARLVTWRRGLAWLLLLISVLALWLSSCTAVAESMQRALLNPPPALSTDRIKELRAAAAKGGIAIVVLGGGRDARAPEYGVASLNPFSLERLRYGLWLSREIGAPAMYSGGLGHAAQPGTTEAEAAADVAAREFAHPLRWTEGRSRDTRENAQFSVALLNNEGLKQIILVTHGWHMPRAQRAFAEAAQRQGVNWEIVPAPMGLAQRVERPALRWMPSTEGFLLTRAVLREKVGLWFGA